MKKYVSMLAASIIVAFATQLVQADEAKKYEFKIETLKAQPVMSVRFKVKPTTNEISAGYTKAFTALYTYVLSNGGQPVGQPFGRYHSITEKEMDIEAGIPVAKAMAETDEIKASALPAGKAVTTIHHGSYDKLSNAHEAMAKYVEMEGLKPSGGLWTVYVTDPGQEPDQSKWQSKLHQPIEDKKAE